MKIAIPCAEGKLAMHFGHCEEFAVVTVDDSDNSIKGTERLKPPAHEPGVLPKWLAEQKADFILAGGMGTRAQQLFAQQGIKVAVGAPSLEPEELVKMLLDGSLECGDNICDH
jgi:predicted Fe-Mo cluster-binding NifX family protein